MELTTGQWSGIIISVVVILLLMYKFNKNIKRKRINVCDNGEIYAIQVLNRLFITNLLSKFGITNYILSISTVFYPVESYKIRGGTHIEFKYLGLTIDMYDAEYTITLHYKGNHCTIDTRKSKNENCVMLFFRQNNLIQ